MEMTIQTREKLHQLALGLIRSNFQSQSGSEAAELPLS
jgi:hypothetical protein